ncbi:putative 2-aminoethylphosphonate ABC transporter ATP-binding protein [Elioraea thermophila]|uniref:putative 2-aminoethylphosphonate ABC transporter ATP-binding protein n=1 Tax=Elioraea thermophila TaxID=2185104 RepID=UPI001E2CEB9C|nr:putative 2-aminoethylphosphonate ABC transporter ATP-binding protein [Elioraea thermophila]
MEGSVARPSVREVRATEPALIVERVTKRFGAFVALDDVSLEVGRGEFVCFLGPSGCGKTTLLRAIAGLDPQDAGRIIQDGRDVSALPPSARDFGIVFQSYALFPNMTVAANVGYGLVSQRKPRAEIEKRVRELLELVGLADQAWKYPAQLSGGQQQRVALARALAMDPGLLLLDEPLSALDALVRAHLRLEIKALQRRLGITTIMVTHDQEEALSIADRVVVMNRGRIEQVGTPDEVYRQPRTLFVAGFVGRMNSLPATVIDATTVQVGAVRFACTAAAGREAGQPVQICLRPEDILPAVTAEAGTRLAATVRGVEYLGSIARAMLDAAGLPLVMEVQDTALRRLALHSGAAIEIVIPPDRVLLFDRAA